MVRVRLTAFIILGFTGSLAGCGDDDNGGGRVPDAGPTERLVVQIDNISNRSELPTPLSPGVWAAHAEGEPLFTVGEPDRGEGLERIAEDGDPTTLAESLEMREEVAASAAFATPVGASEKRSILPGESFEFEVDADEDAPRLSLATMFVQSNDLFFAPAAGGIPIRDELGESCEVDLTGRVDLWDAGTEANEAPGLGPNQAPRQSGPDTGRAEGVVGLFTQGTRALPLASGIADVEVSESDGEYTITLSNVSGERGTIVTPISRVFVAVHDDRFELFRTGEPDAGLGLEALAEDGNPEVLATAAADLDGVGVARAVNAPVDVAEGSAAPGERFQFTVAPSEEFPRLTVASMVVESNDVFLAPDPDGVALLDEEGRPRDAGAVAADLQRELAVWDAGTEANEVPGVGPNQAPRQAAGDTGPEDPDDTVRLYADSTNDLAGERAGGFVDVTVEHAGSPGAFLVTVENTSDETAYPGTITPVLWATHDGSAPLFENGAPASDGLEQLAEDGVTEALAAELGAMSGVGAAEVGGGPLAPGESTSFTVTPEGPDRFLHLAAMVVPSNDTFLAFDPAGIQLLDDQGKRVPEQDLADEVAGSLRAWDAGSEANQAGAAGADQAPRQSAPGTGAAEGSGVVRLVDDPVWPLPQTANVIRVTVRREPCER